MDYNEEQRAIIRRLGEVSTRFDEMVERHKAAQIAAGRNMVDAVTALMQAIDRSNELVALNRQYGDLWREFLDTL